MGLFSFFEKKELKQEMQGFNEKIMQYIRLYKQVIAEREHLMEQIAHDTTPLQQKKEKYHAQLKKLIIQEDRLLKFVMKHFLNAKKKLHEYKVLSKRIKSLEGYVIIINHLENIFLEFEHCFAAIEKKVHKELKVIDDFGHLMEIERQEANFTQQIFAQLEAKINIKELIERKQELDNTLLQVREGFKKHVWTVIGFAVGGSFIGWHGCDRTVQVEDEVAIKGAMIAAGFSAILGMFYGILMQVDAVRKESKEIEERLEHEEKQLQD